MTIKGIPSEVLLAPDSFKGTLSAEEVAEAIGRGLAAHGRRFSVCPVADGGEGTLDVLTGPLGLELERAVVSDPLGQPVEARFGVAVGGAGDAVVEVAAASGLSLIPVGGRDPLAASTRGTGELIVAAARSGARTIYVAAGGSATTDGGSGAIRAIERAGGLGGARLVVLCDVRTPFEDAARVFSPQKGAGPEAVRKLTARLHRLARAFPRDPRGIPLTGAAGGLSGGLWAALGAELVEGARFVLDAVGFDARMRASRAVVTGEGKLDFQSLTGKVVSEVATRARQAGVPCHAIVGQLDLDSFNLRILDLQIVLEASTPQELEAAGGILADRLALNA